MPHEHNDFIPKAAQHKLLFGYGAILLVIKAISLALLVLLPASVIYSSAITVGNIISLTNTTRANSGLDALAENAALNQAATAKAQDMLANQYFAHTSPQGKTPWNWIRGSGYVYDVAGENLAVHYTEAEDVQSAWLASPSHRANILDTRFTEIGVGIVTGNFEGFDSTFVVEMFGKPKSAPVVVPSEEVVSPALELDVAEREDAYVKTVQEDVELHLNDQQGDVLAQISQYEGVEQVLVEEPKSVIDSFVLVPGESENQFTAKLNSEEATAVVLSYNHASTPLEQVGEQTFEGVLETGHADDSLIFASIVTSDGSYITEPVGTLDIDSNTAGFYAFARAQSIRLFNKIPIHIFQDSVSVFYIVAAIFLSAILFMTVLVRFEHQRHTVTAHLLVLLVLTLVLGLM